MDSTADSSQNTNFPDNRFSGGAALFPGGGQMGELMRTYEWSRHPLGNPERWPKSLQTGVRMMLLSGYPMFIWWSSELYMFHNDAYAPTLVGRHGEALGAKAREVWADVWGQLGSTVEDILSKGTTFYAEDMLVVPQRKGFREETYWTFSYSPMPDDGGNVHGIFCACSDVTGKVLSQRRMDTLHQLAEGTLFWQSVEQVCSHSLQVLGQQPADISFAALYLVDQTGNAAAWQGQTSAAPTLPQTLTILGPGQGGYLPEQGWSVLKTEAIRQLQQQLRLAQITASARTPEGIKSELPVNLSLPPAVILPLAGQHQLLGILIVGISPMLEYNEAYQRFHQLLAGQITGDLETLAARQREQDQVLRMQARLQAERDRLYALFAQAPVAITILEGAQYVVRLANPSMLEIWARARQQVLDKPLFEAMPGIRQQGLEELLDGVRVSGKPHVSLQRPVELDRNGNRETLYFNFVYHPLRDDKGSITSIAVVAADVSEQVHSRQKLEESTRQLQALNGELSAANEEIKAGNEQLHASNEELQAANEELLLAREAQARLNSQLEARVEQRTAQLQQARAEVQGQRDRLERFFGQVPAAICVLDGPGLVFELVNPAFQQLYPGRELSGKTVREALPEISKGPFYAILEQVYQTGETYKGTEVPFPLARREGGPQEEVYFDFIYQARLDAHGRVDGILAFGYEVTVQVQARRQVAQAASELSLIMANAPVFLFRTDSAGNLHYVNQTLFEWSGLVLPPGAPLDEVWNLIHPEDLPFVQESFARSVQNQQAWEGPLYRIRRRDGAYRWSITRTQPYLGEDGKLAGFSGVNVEIHQQVELQRQLETINRDLDNFVYTASHDLKAPILNIEGLLKALERQIGPEALQKDTVEKTCHLLDKQVNRFKATIADLTEVARISKESSEDATSINLTDVLEEVLGDLEPQRQEAGAQLTISLDCPAVFFSKKNLKSVLYNLLSNAIKYRSLDRKLLVRIGCQTQADYHVLSVEDNGLGMDMRQEEKIFALFKRLHAHVEGTGIGLYIVRKMVENAGGRIEVESKVGAGSTFRVYFPSAGG